MTRGGGKNPSNCFLIFVGLRGSKTFNKPMVCVSRTQTTHSFSHAIVTIYEEKKYPPLNSRELFFPPKRRPLKKRGLMPLRVETQKVNINK